MTNIIRLSRFDYSSCYLVAGSQMMYSCHLVRIESFTEQIHRWQLTTEHCILVHLWCTAKITLVKWLEIEIYWIINSRYMGRCQSQLTKQISSATAIFKLVKSVDERQIYYIHKHSHCAIHTENLHHLC